MGTQKTNLQNVKCVAHMLLYVDIQTTAFSPMVVSHPFTNDGIVRLLDDTGNITLADLVNNPDDLDRWRQKVGEEIDKAETPYQILMLFDKPYYLTFIKYAASDLSQKDLGHLLSDAWIMAAAPNNDHNVSKRELVALFKSVSPQYLMDQDEYQVYQSLGDIVTVYRGVALSNKTSVKALSWTLDYKTAEGFAHPFGKEGTVYRAQIQKKHIHAYFAGRNESEVIVDPRYLEQIMQVPKQQFSMKMTQK